MALSMKELEADAYRAATAPTTEGRMCAAGGVGGLVDKSHSIFSALAKEKDAEKIKDLPISELTTASGPLSPRRRLVERCVDDGGGKERAELEHKHERGFQRRRDPPRGDGRKEG